jgi:hypothetical protein
LSISTGGASTRSWRDALPLGADKRVPGDECQRQRFARSLKIDVKILAPDLRASVRTGCSQIARPPKSNRLRGGR